MISVHIRGDGLHYKWYIDIYRVCNTFVKFSMTRGMIAVKDQIGVISVSHNIE